MTKPEKHVALDAETVDRVMGSIPNVLCLVGSGSEDEWNGMTAAGSHDVFIGEAVDVGFSEEVESIEVARIEDTRLKHGGVRRGGH